MRAPVAVVQRLVELRLAAAELVRAALAVNRPVELRLAAAELRLAAAALERRSAKYPPTVMERCASPESVRGRRLRR